VLKYVRQFSSRLSSASPQAIKEGLQEEEKFLTTVYTGSCDLQEEK
jgi:hypothetical protein